MDNLKGQYRVKMRGKIEYFGPSYNQALDWSLSLGNSSAMNGRAARPQVEAHNGKKWERIEGWYK
jgi:hypothetical protein